MKDAQFCLPVSWRQGIEEPAASDTLSFRHQPGPTSGIAFLLPVCS